MLTNTNFLSSSLSRLRLVGTAAMVIAISIDDAKADGIAAASAVRELATDRPDATESPVTVDKGMYQVEMSFVSYTRNKSAGTTTESYSIAESNVKYGVSDKTDLQLVFTPYISESTKTGGVKTTAADASDLTVRVKYNLWGNDGGDTALALMPNIKIPTSTDVSNGEWEGGVILPFGMAGGENWSLGLQAEISRVADTDSGGHDWDFSHTAVLGLDVTERAGIYLEYLGVAGDHAYQPFFSGGMTYGINERTQLDAGTMIGLTEAAEDLTVFTGISFKF